MTVASTTCARGMVLLVGWATAACMAEGRPPESASDAPYEPACAIDVPMRRLTASQYEQAITEIFAGHVRPSDRFPAQPGRSATGFTNDPDLLAVDLLAAEQIMLAAEDVALQIPDALPALAPCVVDAPDAACASAFVDAIARRAYRRPPSAEEQAILRRVFDDARADEASFEDAAAMTVVVILQSPQFLYALESGTGHGPVRPLTPYEVATRLALLLWDGVPDEALLLAASEGRLATPDEVAFEAQRMLADPRSARMSRRFFREWMGVAALTETSRNPRLHPWYDAALAASIGTSFDTYVHTAVTEGWTLEKLLTTAQAPVDDVLAAHYGVPAPVEPWSWVELAPSRSVGVMTQPAVMASLAHYDESSYVARGHFIVSGLACRSLGEPPANAVSEAANISSWLPRGASRRALSQAVRRTPACGACHRTLDPPGLAFENFDATGRWRDTDPNGNVIDAAGEIETMRISFSGPRELMEAIARRDEVGACFDRHLFSYFASRLDAEGDTCVLDAMSARTGAGDSMAGALEALITSEAFFYRRASW